MCSKTSSSASDCVSGPVRLIIEAECSRCGSILGGESGLEAIDKATSHTLSTGHIVILNGTVDAPEEAELGERAAVRSPR